MTLLRDLQKDYIAIGLGKKIGSFVYPRFAAVMFYRLAHLCLNAGLVGPARIITMINQTLTGADIDPAARIASPFDLLHTSGVVIANTVVIGSNCGLHQGVTLGVLSWREMTSPKVGNKVIIGANALVLGGVTVGDGARIGAASIVTSDVPSGTTIPLIPSPRPDFP